MKICGNGTNYSVSVLTQPANQNCVINNATGTIKGANIVDVICTNNTANN